MTNRLSRQHPLDASYGWA